MKCPDCGCQEVKLVKTPQYFHYGKEECGKCGRFIKWAKTPKEVKHMKIRENFEAVLDDCEARYAVRSPLKDISRQELSPEDLQYVLCEKALNLLNSKTPAERYSAAMDCVLLTLELASKLREGAPWRARLGVEVIQQPKEPEVTTKECEERP